MSLATLHQEPTTAPRTLEWDPFDDEQGGALKFPPINGVALELHLLDDGDRFLPVWLTASGILLQTLEAGLT
jgi:hypothetical protein